MPSPLGLAKHYNLDTAEMANCMYNLRSMEEMPEEVHAPSRKVSMHHNAGILSGIGAERVLIVVDDTAVFILLCHRFL
jgi:hypothetical protein